MRARTRIAFAAAAAASVAAGALAVAASGGGMPARAERVLQTGRFPVRAYTAAVERLGSRAPRRIDGASVLIVPHHWLAGHLILEGLRDLAAAGPIERVILIGPDHVGAGRAAVTTSDRPWATRFGRVDVDADVVHSLVGSGSAGLDPRTLSLEHSIWGIVPAIAATMPGARVVPLAVRAQLTMGELRALAGVLAPLLGETSVLVASVDFAHYITHDQAVLSNRETMTALHAMDATTILGWGNEHLDSPPGIVLAVETARRAGAHRFVPLADMDSSALGGSSWSVTSYISGVYAR